METVSQLKNGRPSTTRDATRILKKNTNNIKRHSDQVRYIPVEKKSTENMPSRISVFMVACWFEFSSLVIVQVVHTTGIVPKVKVSNAKVLNEGIGTYYK